jgi:hypothetical protein
MKKGKSGCYRCRESAMFLMSDGAKREVNAKLSQFIEVSLQRI